MAPELTQGYAGPIAERICPKICRHESCHMECNTSEKVKTDVRRKHEGKDWTERLFDRRPTAIAIQCKGCGRDIFIPPSKRGQRSVCDKACSDLAKSKSEKKGHWVDRIFENRQGVIEKKCAQCQTSIFLPKSKLDRVFCGEKCQAMHREITKEKWKFQCASCGKVSFADRKNAKFCSQKCNGASGHLTSPKMLALSQEARRKAIARGDIKYKSGPENPLWKGGPKALRQRQTDSGKSAMWLRRYRKANPDKVREFSQRRRSLKLKLCKLPYGTIPRIYKMQRGKCGLCRVKLNGKYHVDHIISLSRGGLHEPSNLQVLCPSCNLKKSDKDQMEFARSMGMLL